MLISIEELKEMFGNETLTIKQLKEKNHKILNCSSISLAHLLSEYFEIEIIDSKPKKYKIGNPIIFTGEVEKEKNLLKIKTINNNFVVYDFNINDFISNNINENTKIKCQNRGLANIFCSEDYKNLRSIEWLYNYIDLLDTSVYNLKGIENYKTCPIGYINYIKNNDLKINYKTLKDYIISKQFKNIPPKALQEFREWYYFDNIECFKIIDILFQNGLEKILRNTLKNFDFDIKYQLKDLIFTLNTLEEMKINWLEYLDNNRDLETNITNMQSLKNQKKNETINKNLQKFNFLNNIKIEDLIIKVPQNVNDLINEGKQQNNCIGYYYNNSIAENKNAIYFIRKQEKPQQSYITCRYNYNDKETVEYRIKNNFHTDAKENKIIKQIDNIINKYLENGVDTNEL